MFWNKVIIIWQNTSYADNFSQKELLVKLGQVPLKSVSGQYTSSTKNSDKFMGGESEHNLTTNSSKHLLFKCQLLKVICPAATKMRWVELRTALKDDAGLVWEKKKHLTVPVVYESFAILSVKGHVAQIQLTKQ